MNNLESSIALRVMDTFGIFTKDMPSIKQNQFKIKNNLWSAEIGIDDGDSVVALYMEQIEKKYIIIGNKKDKSINFWYCIVSLNVEENDPNLNKIYIANKINNDIKYRESLTIEMANMLIGFETIRQYSIFLTEYKPTFEDISTITNFINSISIENNEDMNDN